MSETINTTIYNDNIQSTSITNTQLYTNKLNGNIILGNSNVNVSITNLSVTNLSVTNISVTNLSANNITYIQDTGSIYYLNNNNTIGTIQTTIPSSTTPVGYQLTTNGTSVKSFNILGSTLKQFNNSLITMNLFSNITVNLDTLGKIQYNFTISSATGNTGTVYANSVLSDDINNITATQSSYSAQLYLSSDTINSLIDSTNYFLNIRIYTSVTTNTTKRLTISYDTTSYVSTINILKITNIGYTNNITNNWVYAAATGVQDTFTMTTGDQEFGNSMYLSKGIWQITMYTSIVSSAGGTYSYFNII